MFPTFPRLAKGGPRALLVLFCSRTSKPQRSERCGSKHPSWKREADRYTCIPTALAEAKTDRANNAAVLILTSL